MSDKNYKYDDSYPDLLINHLSKGYSFESFGGTIGVVRSTIFQWALDIPEFKAAKEIGYQKSLSFYEKLLSAKVSGQKIEGFDPRKSDTACLIFALKTRFHKIYGEKKDVEHSGDIIIKIDKQDVDL